MQLKQIKISNLLSFPYLGKYDQSESLSFFNQESYAGLKILIGNTASGKSNFINILQEFFSTFIFDFSYDPDAETMRKVITSLPTTTKNLHTHYDFPNQKSELELLIDLGVNDYENIGFVCKYNTKINEIINKYSKLELSFPQYKLEQIQALSSSLKISATFDEKTQEFSIKTEHYSPEQLFILQCLQYHKLLQFVIHIFNEKERKENERKRYFLKKTFAIINTNRDLIRFNNFIHPSELINDPAPNSSNLIGYTNCIHKFWRILENCSQTQLLSGQFVENPLENSDFFKSLSYIIEKFLNKKLKIEYINQTLNIHLVDNSQRIVYFDELSSGEKTLLTIIFGLYGNDLKEGFLLINEPESHLHPQVQKELTQTLENITENIQSQIILSTNSSLFINENNITSVYRVYKDQFGASKIIAPKIHVDYDDATLIHMLKFENLSKIFFVNKIILVEGDTDSYFFSFYLNYLRSLPEWKEKLKDYEVININGKGSYHTWKKFLDKFNIKNYFIGDRDNTVDY